jgi:hypothetical protein
VGDVVVLKGLRKEIELIFFLDFWKEAVIAREEILLYPGIRLFRKRKRKFNEITFM